jgi:hypothetical protein
MENKSLNIIYEKENFTWAMNPPHCLMQSARRQASNQVHEH